MASGKIHSQTKNGKSGWLQYSVSPEAEKLEDFFLFFIFRFFFVLFATLKRKKKQDQESFSPKCVDEIYLSHKRIFMKRSSSLNYFYIIIFTTNCNTLTDGTGILLAFRICPNFIDQLCTKFYRAVYERFGRFCLSRET